MEEEDPQFVIEDNEFVGQVFDLDVATGQCVFTPPAKVIVVNQ